MSVFWFMRVLSLFIISGLYVYMVVCIVYTYNLTWEGLKNWQKWGRAKRVLSCFCRVTKKKSHGNFRGAPLSSELFREIFFEFHLVYSQSMSDRFSAHIRPVIHISFQHVFQICLQYIYSNVINTNVCTLMIYSIMLAPLFILGITGFCLTNKYNFHTVKYISLIILKNLLISYI